ncbi:aldehyde dehydrogenase family protein [Leucobacter japonicus]|uniref:aldehyde dehydrogenase family protein n=1 Tax=Leucobacter japonicus TaxID=1461259 RepID=UPI0006A77DF7|nr:aldehyde dehydrogenase family protein [Leucobacter japonicus]
MPITTVNPTTGALEAEFPAIDDTEVRRRVELARATYDEYRTTSFAERAALTRRAADLMEADAESLAELITLEMGKPIAQSRGEVAKSAACLRYYADRAEGFLAPEPLADPAVVNAAQAYATYHPIGPVLAVMPWNYPIWQVIRFAAPTLMAGNTALLKHASNVPQAALYLDDLFRRAGFPEGAFQTLLIPASKVDAIIRSAEVAAVTITGSEPAGRQVAQAAGESIKPSVLELGGSDPFIVMPSADLDGAVATAVASRTSNNGQACINAKRFIVHADVYDVFVERFVAALESLVIGDPFDAATQVGPLATEQGRQDVIELVENAREHGAAILTGGEKVGEQGWFYRPTVIADIPTSAEIRVEECFGPVASVYRVDSIDQALSIANETRFGLGSAIWTEDDAEISRAISELDAGAVNVNGMTISYPELPFGGVKASGYGRELSAAGIRAFCNQKTVWVR